MPKLGSNIRSTGVNTGVLRCVTRTFQYISEYLRCSTGTLAAKPPVFPHLKKFQWVLMGTITNCRWGLVGPHGFRGEFLCGLPSEHFRRDILFRQLCSGPITEMIARRGPHDSDIRSDLSARGVMDRCERDEQRSAIDDATGSVGETRQSCRPRPESGSGGKSCG